PTLQAHELSRRAFRQGVRAGDDHAWSQLSAQQVSDLADAIVAHMRTKHRVSGPFRSLGEFLSGSPEWGGISLLERAIADAGVNPAALAPSALAATEDDPGFCSLTLTQADILTALAPYLRVRSDTFAIRAYGESINPVTGGATARAWCEATVQRGPAPVDPTDSIVAPDGRYGRAFTIRSFRWLPPDEL
ncbi:MAG TPA: hypothetical protein VHF69_08845, partial [Candidatus Synoicihabitans sp.]|nr:hypothetical protein [Candidatus Synoicihabitans sp.]